jgi:hypothetical protein
LSARSVIAKTKVRVCAYRPTFTRSVVLTQIEVRSVRVPVVMKIGVRGIGVLRKVRGVVRERRGVVPKESDQRPKGNAVVLTESGVAIPDVARTSAAGWVKQAVGRKARTLPARSLLPECQTLN